SSVQAQAVQSDKERVTSPDVGDDVLQKLVSGNSAFSFDLYQAIRSNDANVFYSPYSISLALAMTYAGARSETARQMADTLHFTVTQDRLHPAFNALDLELSSRGHGAKGKDGEGFRLSIANSIWGQRDYTFLAEFLDVLAQNYGAGLRLLDFEKAPDDSRVVINDWVADETEDRINDLLPDGSITPLTRLVLTNAIYFNAAWKYAFEEDFTEDGTFHLLDGDQVTVPMMSQTETFDYAEGAGFQAVELPYDGDELSMLILLPAPGQFDGFASTLDAERWDSIVGIMAREQIHLTMPKFSYDARLDLAEVLADLGMPDAFSMAADFSGMDGTRDLFISGVFHKAFVAVDEAGTEAAAATAVVISLKAMPGMPREVSIDRPFLFAIRDIKTGAILFVGHVVNPAA
ncbi:MAG TPA: serpin family protein, partial [Anaerolineae bacterium]|nr:serpin family protein [Anaerolineae bacterium]